MTGLTSSWNRSKTTDHRINHLPGYIRMDDATLLATLLQHQEADELDFKSDQYRLDNDYLKSEFIKDILAMANTPRSESSFILLGVEEQSGKVTGTPGVLDHPDEADLGRIIAGKVEPSPRFSYRQINIDGLSFGLIEIPCGQPVPFLPRRDYGVIREKCVYLRRNTQNVAADREDLARIHNWRKSDPSYDPKTPAGAWEQLYRAADGFDQRRIYIAVFDREPEAEPEDWSAMASVNWSVVVDYDTGTDTVGNFAAARTQFSERRALHLTALDEVPAITSRSIVWIAAAGLDSRPTTRPSGNWRDWNRSKSPMLERAMNELARLTEPAPVTVIVFSGDAQHVTTTCEVIDRTFAYRVDYVFASQDVTTFENLVDSFDATAIAISLPDVCHGLRELGRDVELSQTTRFPRFGGGTVAMPIDRARWVEEQLELVHWDVGLAAQDQTLEDAFLKGAIVSWNELNVGVDADRAARSSLEHQIRKELEVRATRRVNFWHWPGAGATTVARRIAWNLQREYPTVVALEIEPQQTAERVRYLFGITRLPILIVIDLPGVTAEVVDRFYDALRRSHVPAVLFNVERRFDARVGSGTHYLDAMLTTREAVALSGVLTTRVPSRRQELELLIDEADRRKRSPFYFGLVAFGRDFQGLEAYVAARLSRSTDPIREAVILMAFAYYYGQVSLSLQTFAPVFGIRSSKLVIMSEVIPDYLRELLVDVNNGVRPAHQLIAEEVLQQELGQKTGNRRNWRNGLADLAISFVDLLSALPHGDRGVISSILRAVIIERGYGQSPAGPWDAGFSRFLDDIPSVEGQQRVLEHLTEALPEEPHFWAHLGRFYSRVVRDHSKAHVAHEAALGIISDDPLLHHMAGMGWRNELYDHLNSLDSDSDRATEDRTFQLVGEATREFEAARALDRRSEYNYISQVQMIQRVVGQVSNAKGFLHEVMRFLTLRGNDRYRELVDVAQNLLSDLALIKGDETPSQFHVRTQADLERLHGNHAEAIQRLTNALDRRESFKPPLRRAIIRAYIARRRDDWGQLTQNELARVVELAIANIEEEPASDYNLRLWLRAVRTENALDADRVAERLTYKRLQDPSVDTTYYLYIMKFLQLELGDLAAAAEVPVLIEECVRLGRHLSRASSSFEWLGREAGIASLVHVSTLGGWDVQKEFWANTDQLRPVKGHIARIRDQGSGEIELTSGLRAFFTPSRGAVPGGYIAGQDVGREVEFFLGFSYEGLRAWSVRDPDSQ